jgi:hypothetical protein
LLRRRHHDRGCEQIECSLPVLFHSLVVGKPPSVFWRNLYSGTGKRGTHEKDALDHTHPDFNSSNVVNVASSCSVIM